MLTVLLCQADTVKFAVYFAQTTHPLAFLASRMASDVVSLNPSECYFLSRAARVQSL